MPVCCIYNSKGRELLRFNTDTFAGKGRIVVGRSSGCDVSLKQLAQSSISREHFYLEQDSHGQWSIHDTSRAGIVIDCAKVESAPLFSGMVVRFGQLFFGFGDKSGPSRYRLTWFNSDMGMDQYAVLWNGSNSIGASHDNYVTIRLGSISRFHCRIDVTPTAVMLNNISPMVETAVNDEPVTGPTRLNVGDMLLLGDIEVSLTQSDVPEVRVGDIMSEHELRSHNKGAEIMQRQRPLAVVVALIFIVGVILVIVISLMKLVPGTSSGGY